MGFVDRGGGREAKGSSLRRSKKNPGAAAAKVKTQGRQGMAVPLNPQAPEQPKLVPSLPYSILCTQAKDEATRLLANPYAARGGGCEADDAGHCFSAENLRDCVYSSSFCPFFDCCVSLLSRKFDTDRERLLERAQTESGVGAMLCWSSEVLKQEALVQECSEQTSLFLAPPTNIPRLPFCTTDEEGATQQQQQQQDFSLAPDGPRDFARVKKAKKVTFHDEQGRERKATELGPSGSGVGSAVSFLSGNSALLTSTAVGHYYCLVGIHPDNIDRTNKKQQDEDMRKIRSLAMFQQSVGILSGLNFHRDPGTYFAQESNLKRLWSLAGRLRKPLVLFLISSHVGAVEDDGAAGDTHAQDREAAERMATLLRELIEESEVFERSVDEESAARTSASAVETGHAVKGRRGKKVGGGALESAHIDAFEDPTAALDDCGKLYMPPAVVLHSGLAVLSTCPAMKQLVRSFRHGHCPTDALETGPPADGLNSSDTPPKGPKFYVMVSADGFNEQGSVREKEYAALLKEDVGLDQVLVSTDAPRFTPVNIEDEYIRSQHNEPANYLSVLRLVYQAAYAEGTACSSAEELGWMSRENALACFFSSLLQNARMGQSTVPSKGMGEEDNGRGNVSDADSVVSDEREALPANDSGRLRAQPIAHASPNRHYNCFKCRAYCFPEVALVTHPVNAQVVQFKSSAGAKGKKKGCRTDEAEGGACRSACFVDVQSMEGAAKRLGLHYGHQDDDESGALAIGVLEGLQGDMAAYCASCRSKLGALSRDAVCPCGSVVPGTTVRIAVSRLELVDKALSGDGDGNDLNAILERAAQERELRGDGEWSSGGDSSSDDESRKKPRQKVNVKASNRSNFTHFRNKNFAGGSRGRGKDGAEEVEQALPSESVGKPKRRKGKLRNKHGESSSDHMSDDSNSDSEGRPSPCGPSKACTSNLSTKTVKRAATSAASTPEANGEGSARSSSDSDSAHPTFVVGSGKGRRNKKNRK